LCGNFLGSDNCIFATSDFLARVLLLSRSRLLCRSRRDEVVKVVSIHQPCCIEGDADSNEVVGKDKPVGSVNRQGDLGAGRLMREKDVRLGSDGFDEAHVEQQLAELAERD
jgi:hypothetical protein